MKLSIKNLSLIIMSKINQRGNFLLLLKLSMKNLSLIIVSKINQRGNFLLLLFLLSCVSPVFAVSLDDFEARIFSNGQGLTMPYRLFVPENYDETGSFPLVVSLHGDGAQKGDDNTSQITRHPQITIFADERTQINYPSFLVAPQYPVGGTWFPSGSNPSESMILVGEIVDSLLAEFPGLNSEKVYVTGVSAGGGGTMYMKLTFPDKVAAAIPIAGVASQDVAINLSDFPMWSFVNEGDQFNFAVLLDSLTNAIKAFGGDPLLTVFSSNGHNAWETTYSNPNIIPWIFQYQIDNSVSSAPTALMANALSDKSIGLTWSAAIDPDSIILEYHIYRDGLRIAQVAGDSYGDVAPTEFIDNDNIVENTIYTYEVLAVNAGNIKSPLSPSITVISSPDTTAPAIVKIGGGTDYLKVLFDESLESISAENPNNYTLNNGALIISATVDTDGRTVTLMTTPLTVGIDYVLTVSNVENIAATPTAIDPAGVDVTFQNIPSNGLKVWLRADFGVSTGIDGTVFEWEDSSIGGMNGIQRASYNQPLLVADGGNGQPVLRFDGSGDHIQLPVGFSDFTGGLTTFIVAKSTAVNNESRFFDFGNAENNDSLVFARDGTSQSAFYQVYNGQTNGDGKGSSNGGKAVASDIILEDEYHLYSLNQAAGFSGEQSSVAFYLDGVIHSSGSTAIPDIVNRQFNYIGWWVTTNPLITGGEFEGDIAEILVYNRDLSKTEREEIEQYLYSKYIGVDLINRPPFVSIESKISQIEFPSELAISATVEDDERGSGSLSINWSKISGSGFVTFAPANAANTVVSFSIPGTYVLRLTVDDGEYVVTEDYEISVLAQGLAFAGLTPVALGKSNSDLVSNVTEDGFWRVSGRGIGFDAFISPPNGDALSYFEGFETMVGGTLNNQNGWLLEGAPDPILISEAFEGIHALQIENEIPPIGVEADSISIANDISSQSFDSVWTDIYVQPVAMSESSPPEMALDANIGFFFTQDGYLMVYDGHAGVGNWRKIGLDVSLDISEWIRVTIHQNNINEIWSIWLNGCQIAQNLGFANSNQNKVKIAISQDSALPTLLDNINISDSEPEALEHGDDLNFEQRTLAGDFTVTARVRGIDEVDNEFLVGLMIRNGADENAAFAMIGVDDSGQFVSGSRLSSSELASTVALVDSYEFPDAWLRMTRLGDVVEVFISDDGSNWTRTKIYTFPALEEAVKVGLFVASGIGAKVVTASFSHFNITAIEDSTDVLFVIGNGGTANTGEEILKSQMENAGMTVQFVDGAVSSTADADGKRLVIIGSSVSSGNVGTKFRDVEAPVMLYENFLYDDMGMTGNTSGIDYGNIVGQTQISVINGSDPLAAGLSGPVHTYSINSVVTWGVPNGNAVIVASLIDDASRASLFYYPRGSSMFGFDAVGPRIGYFLENDGPDLFTSESEQLFDALLAYALEQSINHPPTVFIVGEHSLVLPETLPLVAIVADDGLPVAGDLTIQWSGPSDVNFSDLNAASTNVSFEKPGIYNLSLTVEDGEFTTTEDWLVEVTADNLSFVDLMGEMIGSGTGSTTVEVDGLWKINATGSDVYSDNFYFENKSISGDFDVRLQVRDLLGNQTDAIAGLMIRESNDVGSRFVSLGAVASKAFVTGVRKEVNEFAAVSTLPGTFSFPDAWLRLTRIGDWIIIFTSNDGVNWKNEGNFELIGLPDSVLLGVFGSSDSSTEAVTIVIDNFLLNENLNDALFRGIYFHKQEYSGSSLPSFATTQHLIPAPVLDGNPEWISLYWDAWELAYDHYVQPATNSGVVSNYMDEAFDDDLYQWDTLFMVLFGRYNHNVFPAIESLDNFYHAQESNGFIPRAFPESSGASSDECEDCVNPPLFSWVEWENYQLTGNLTRLGEVLTPLKRYAQWLEMERLSVVEGNDVFWNTPLGSGMDNTPRRGRGWIDMTSQMIMLYTYLSKMADELGDSEESVIFENRASELIESVASMWDGFDGLYYDVDEVGAFVRFKTIAAFWPMLAGATDYEIDVELVSHLRDVNAFKRLIPFPTLAADEPLYDPLGGYWLGGVWAPTNYAVIKGLELTGYEAFAREVSESYIEGLHQVLLDTDTLWENYAPDSFSEGNRGPRADFVGWTGLGPIALLLENVIGLRPDAANGRLVWHLSRIDRNGVTGYRMGSNVISVESAQRASNSELAQLTINNTEAFLLEVNLAGNKRIYTLDPGSHVIDMNDLDLVAPTVVNATLSDTTTVMLSWDDVNSDETGYEILRRESNLPVWAETSWVSVGVVLSNTTAFEDSLDSVQVTAYDYAIRAVRGIEKSEVSIPVILNTQAPVAVITGMGIEPFRLNSPINFDGQASSISSGVITNSTWDFGDTNSADGSLVNHAYSNAGDYLVTLTVTADNGLSATATEWVRVVDFDTIKPVLLVTDSIPLVSEELALVAHLEATGYTVTIAEQNSATANDSVSMAAVIISSRINSAAIADTFRNVSTPVMVYERFLFDDMGMTLDGDFGSVGFGNTLEIIDDTHPIAAGLSGIPVIYLEPSSVTWGQPNASAETIATISGNPAQAAIFVYEEGDEMFGLVAPGRRAGFFLDSVGPSLLTARGWLLFDATLDWLVENYGASPVIAPINVNAEIVGLTTARISWEDTNVSELGYRIFRRPGPTYDWGEIGTVAADVVIFDDLLGTLQLGSYEYTVRAFNDIQNSPFAIKATVNTLAPIANIQVTPSLIGSVDLPLNFDGTGSTDTLGNIVDWEWDFGDDTSAVLGSDLTYTYSASGTYTITLMVTSDTGLQSLATVDVQISEAGDILYVVGDTDLNIGDSFLKLHLESRGFVVTVVADENAQSTDVINKSLVIISSTVSSGLIGTSFRDVTVPVLVYENFLLDEMGMTLASEHERGIFGPESFVNIINPSHPITDGLSDVVEVFHNTSFMTWGKPEGEAQVIATFENDLSRSTLFVWEAGAQMNGLVAPAKRAGMFLENDTPSLLTAEGEQLVDGTINWLLNVDNKYPIVAIATPTEGTRFSTGSNVTLSADATDLDGSITSVEFLLNGDSLAIDVTEPFELTTLIEDTGVIELSAIAIDNLGATIRSAPVNIVLGREIEIWKALYFSSVELADITISGDFADPDNDGIATLVEYALGLNPMLPDVLGITGDRFIDDTDAYLQMSYVRPTDRAELDYRVQVSDDMTVWGSGPTATATVQITDHGDTESVFERDLTSVLSANRRFMRLAVDYVDSPTSYNQNFDSLDLGSNGVDALWQNDSTLPGWYANRSQIRVSDGSGSTLDSAGFARIVSFGTALSEDRALGSSHHVHDGEPTVFGMKLHNASGDVIDKITIAFDGEQWRRASLQVPENQTLTFSCAINAIDITLGNYFRVPELDFSSIDDGSSNGFGSGLDGNQVRLQRIQASIGKLSWLPNTDLWLRWVDLNNTSNDHGLAIDNVSIVIMDEDTVLAIDDNGNVD